MRICLVNALFHPYSGGIEKHMYELARELAARGDEVTVVTGRTDDLPARERLEGFEVRRVPCWAIKAPLLYPPPLIVSPFFYHYLKKLDRELRFDVIHLHNRFFIDFDLAALYARLHHKPFVMTVHNPRPGHVDAAVGTIGAAYDWLVGRWPFVLADRVIAVSGWAKEDIAVYGIDRGKIATIYNGIDAEAYRPSDGAMVRKKFGVDGFMLLFVGRMVHQKGVNYLLDALPRVLEAHPGTRLVLVGTGTQQEELKRRARRLGLDGAAIFAGYLDEEELRRAYSACDVFILPSIVEPFGIVIVEALASGKPVICTDSGGIREIVDDGVDGYIVPPRDPEALAGKINVLLGDARLREDMGRRGRETVEKRFAWGQIALETRRIYEAALAGRPNP